MVRRPQKFLEKAPISPPLVGAFSLAANGSSITKNQEKTDDTKPVSSL